MICHYTYMKLISHYWYSYLLLKYVLLNFTCDKCPSDFEPVLLYPFLPSEKQTKKPTNKKQTNKDSSHNPIFCTVLFFSSHRASSQYIFISIQKQSLPNCFTRFIYILHSFNIFIFEAKFFLKLFPVAAWMVGKIILSCQKLFFESLLIPPFLFKMYIT